MQHTEDLARIQEANPIEPLSTEAVEEAVPFSWIYLQITLCLVAVLLFVLVKNIAPAYSQIVTEQYQQQMQKDLFWEDIGIDFINES